MCERIKKKRKVRRNQKIYNNIGIGYAFHKYYSKHYYVKTRVVLAKCNLNGNFYVLCECHPEEDELRLYKINYKYGFIRVKEKEVYRNGIKFREILTCMDVDIDKLDLVKGKILKNTINQEESQDEI